MNYRVPEHPRGFVSGEAEEQAVLEALRQGRSLSYAGPNLPGFEGPRENERIVIACDG
ncbi:MAG: hypothetical protein AAF916_09010 [Planctomycetota bacterium]